MIYVFEARFHANVQALHHSTLEITCEERLTPRGDCIILVGSKHNVARLNEECKKGEKAILCVLLPLNSICVTGICNSIKDKCSIVIRTSNRADGRTLLTLANIAAKDIPRNIIHEGRLWGHKVVVILMSTQKDHGVLERPRLSLK